MTHSAVPVPGSTRSEFAAERLLGPVAASTSLEMTLVLRRRAGVPPEAFAGPPLTRTELGERYGADPADLEAVTRELEAGGAEIISADPITRLVRVRGSAEVLSGMFGTSLQQARLGADDAAIVRVRSGELVASPTLSSVLIGALGLDNRPQAQARYRVARAGAEAVSYTPLEIAAAYSFPEGDGTGQTIAIIELGGGFAQSDLDSYFGGLGLTPPTVTAVGVDGATNQAGQDPNGADGEVLLDIEVAGAVAPAARQLVYFAPNSDAGFVDAITQAAHASPTPTAMSISWGQSEDQWSAQARTSMDNAVADAVLLGVTVTAAAGDSGSTDNETQGAPHVDFPASGPHALACGGTTLRLDSSGAVSTEVVWNDGDPSNPTGGGSTGGGISTAFPVPAWQAGAGVPVRAGGAGGTGGVGGPGTAGRGVPDVAGNADPQTGYQVLVDGQVGVIGGTSAVSPLLAGLVCRLAQNLGRPLGLLQPAIYAAAAPGVATPGFRDITSGSNGAYSATTGWDACTGLGVPDGTALLDVLRASTA
jgi:kumamolisin